ncbi:cob(I)alamin adenosyltransferase [Mariniphaga anaerophila]|uniref:Corrinoid adenosyltransferase n=1 Tax=Mariniphaga anaerophila TaxID=1484053 RepID=A0A1M4W579_9BACT|nr:cob(I)yrinic acid a,c-diamide adenosyltransferase [Mariniphaga anaerophila]SHE76418.1 cob(I)alamin adenosyltransferase [Mariniphaga anaerophila]
MSKEFKIYTKTGDDGSTGLVGGSRVKKYDIRLEAYGTVDELNALIGVIRSAKLPENHAATLVEIQNKLFNIGSLLASDERGRAFTERLSITEQNISFLENAIDEMEEGLPALKHFILPGGDFAAAQCHVARTVCRRAERRILEFAEKEEVQPEIVKYVNRLSDFLFVLARKLAVNSGIEESPWKQS